MAFTDKEKQLIIYGKTNGKSQQEVEQALIRLRTGQGPVQPVAPVEPKHTLIGDIGADLNQRADKVGEIINRPGTGIVEKGLQIFGQGAGAAANAAESTVGAIPGVKQAIGVANKGVEALSKTAPIQAVGNAIGSHPFVQDLVKTYDTDKNFKDTVDAVANTIRLGGDISAALDGINAAVNVTKKVSGAVSKSTAPIATKLGSAEVKLPGAVGNIKSDIIPGREQLINSEVTKALDLTQGDVKNIHQSTGNEVGEFISKNNLIGETVTDTVKNLDDFYKTNYNTVREEIGKVTKTYTPAQIPRYQEALKSIKQQIQDTPGLQEANAEIDTLLKKASDPTLLNGDANITLNDVQRVKELMDDHFSLYKATGDVKEGVAKSGLANIRKDLKGFIEKEVKQNTGTDIRDLNNNVMTARSINDAIDTRSTRGLTRSNISAADIVTFLAGSGIGTPVMGALAVLVKKIYESPSFKLKVVKWLDSLSDAARTEVTQSLQKGVLPPEIETMFNAEPTLMDKARGTFNTIKKEGNKGFVKIPGLGDTKSGVTPEAVATKMDDTDFHALTTYVKKPSDLQAHMKAQPIIDAMGIDKLSHADQTKFLEEALAKYEADTTKTIKASDL